jgi:Periplasmic copper-binding protein (NosD)
MHPVANFIAGVSHSIPPSETNKGLSPMDMVREAQGLGKFALLTALSWVLLAAFAAPAHAGKVTPIAVTSCATLSKSFGVYLVANNITNSGQGDCIIVAANSVSLNLQTYSLTGSRKGAGVHVLSGMTGALIENGSISGFAIGISADRGAHQLVVTNMQVTGNTDGLIVNNSNNTTVSLSSLDSNLNSGASLLNSNGGVFNGDAIDSNSTGVYLSGSSGFNFNICGIGPDNLKTGVYLNNSNNNAFLGDGINATEGYGVWVVNSSYNRFDEFGASGYLAGVFVGCSSTGPGGSCGYAQRGSGSSHNTFVQGLSSATNGPGIAIDFGNTSNRVVQINTTNEFTSALGTLFDGNPKCDSDIWSLNTFASANQACIN